MAEYKLSVLKRGDTITGWSLAFPNNVTYSIFRSNGKDVNNRVYRVLHPSGKMSLPFKRQKDAVDHILKLREKRRAKGW